MDKWTAIGLIVTAILVLSRAYLAAHEDCSWLDGGVEQFEPCTIEPHDRSTFVLELTHPADLDGGYRVEFEAGVAVNSGRND